MERASEVVEGHLLLLARDSGELQQLMVQRGNLVALALLGTPPVTGQQLWQSPDWCPPDSQSGRGLLSLSRGQRDRLHPESLSWGEVDGVANRSDLLAGHGFWGKELFAEGGLGSLLSVFFLGEERSGRSRLSGAVGRVLLFYNETGGLWWEERSRGSVFDFLIAVLFLALLKTFLGCFLVQ